MVKKQPIISVIVPIYNRASFLPVCIESIITQSYVYLDIILVDDGSTDNSLNICRNYEQRDKRIRVFHIPNSGVSTARNTGIQYAKGDFIQFVDSDDTIKQDMCEILLEEQQKNDADLVLCGFDNIDTTRKHLFYQSAEEPIYDINVFYNKFGNLIECNLIYSPVNKLYKKQIINNYKIAFIPDFNIAEDALFNFNYCHYVQNIAVTPRNLYNRLNHEDDGRLTQRLHKNFFYIQKILFQNLINLLTEKGVYDGENKNIVKTQYAQIFYMGITMLKNHNKEVNYNEISPYLVPGIFTVTHCDNIVIFWKKYLAVQYMKENKTIIKKLYGAFKALFWQCAEWIRLCKIR